MNYSDRKTSTFDEDKPSPMYFWTSSEPLTRINVHLVWWATARARSVLPIGENGNKSGFSLTFWLFKVFYIISILKMRVLSIESAYQMRYVDSKKQWQGQRPRQSDEQREAKKRQIRHRNLNVRTDVITHFRNESIVFDQSLEGWLDFSSKIYEKRRIKWRNEKQMDKSMHPRYNNNNQC